MSSTHLNPTPAQIRTGQDNPTLGTVLALLGLRPAQIIDGRFGAPADDETPWPTLADNLCHGYRADHTPAHILDMPIYEYGWCLMAGTGSSYVSCGGEALVYFKASRNAREAYIVRDDTAGQRWDWDRAQPDGRPCTTARPHPTYRFAQSG